MRGQKSKNRNKINQIHAKLTVQHKIKISSIDRKEDVLCTDCYAKQEKHKNNYKFSSDKKKLKMQDTIAMKICPKYTDLSKERTDKDV